MSDANVRVITLLDELEEVFEASSRMPFSEKGLVDVDTALSIIKDIRLTLPKDLQEAEWIRQEKNRIIEDAKSEYNKIIMAAKDQAEYLVETDAIKKEAEKRANALLSEAENHSRYMKLRAYEYVDKILFDMQNDIAGIANEYIQPMQDYFNEMVGNINLKVNGNRQEMRNLAQRVQMSDINSEE
ncbi:MAG: hypothetical protein PUD55_04710 [Firmicutes bacterium]|nr:hypothetical protein [Bacillota bacterium]